MASEKRTSPEARSTDSTEQIDSASYANINKGAKIPTWYDEALQ